MRNLKFEVVAAIGAIGLGVAAWGDAKTTHMDASGRVQGTEADRSLRKDRVS